MVEILVVCVAIVASSVVLDAFNDVISVWAVAILVLMVPILVVCVAIFASSVVLDAFNDVISVWAVAILASFVVLEDLWY